MGAHVCTGAQHASSETVVRRQCLGNPLARFWRGGLETTGVQLADYGVRDRSAVAETIRPRSNTPMPAHHALPMAAAASPGADFRWVP